MISGPPVESLGLVRYLHLVNSQNTIFQAWYICLSPSCDCKEQLQLDLKQRTEIVYLQ